MLWFNFVFYAATVTSSIRAIEGFARFRAYALLENYKGGQERLQEKFYWSRLLAAYYSADGRTRCGYFCLLIMRRSGHEGFGQLTKAGIFFTSLFRPE